MITYCGLTREWNQTCETATYTCSAPGAIFDLNISEKIFVLWVNNV